MDVEIKICLTCLEPSPEMTSVFDKAPGLEIPIADLIAQYLWTFSKVVPLPEHICQTCLQMLLQFKKDEVKDKDPLNVKDSGDALRKRYKCSECPRAYVHKYELRIHMITHTGERPHKCPQCGKRFGHKCSLRRHILGHSGERPYRCPICPKACSHKHDLKTHMRTHTGERPHKCAECAKAFSHKCTLNKHLTTHYKERPFQCSLCPKAFSVKNYLQKHMKVHLRKGECEETSGEVADLSLRLKNTSLGEQLKF